MAQPNIPEIITGQAVLHGIQNNGSLVTLTGYASFILDRIEGQHMFDKYKVKDPLGNDTSAVAFNERFEITIDFTPSGATRAAAALIPTVPIPLAAVTLSNCKVQTAFGSSAVKLFDGTYLYEGDARISQQSAVAVKLSGLKLTKYADTSQNTNMTSPVVG